MIDTILLYLGAFLPFFWGIARLFPTKSTVSEFGDISLDNRRIITMEWIVEGVSLIFVGIVVAVVTYLDRASTISTAIYWIAFVMLNTLSIVSLFTGFKVSFLPFKLCPVIFSTSSLLILLGSIL